MGDVPGGPISAKSYRSRREERRRQEILLQAAYVLAEQGYHGVTLEAIASRLEMTKGSLYYYYPDKQQILYLVLKQGAQAALDYINRQVGEMVSPTDKLGCWVDAHIRFICQEMPFSVTLLQTDAILENVAYEEVQKLLAQYNKVVDQILENGINAGVFTVVPIRATRNFILGALNWIPRWYTDQDEMSLTKLISVYRTHVLKLVGQ
ncbi:MAG: TetR/AcrR family transcriptional regulator [Sulfobacillus sp.]